MRIQTVTFPLKPSIKWCLNMTRCSMQVSISSSSCAGEAVRASLWKKERTPLKEYSAGDLGVFNNLVKQFNWVSLPKVNGQPQLSVPKTEEISWYASNHTANYSKHNLLRSRICSTVSLLQINSCLFVEAPVGVTAKIKHDIIILRHYNTKYFYIT